jgi:hypothetical protein
MMRQYCRQSWRYWEYHVFSIGMYSADEKTFFWSVFFTCDNEAEESLFFAQNPTHRGRTETGVDNAAENNARAVKVLEPLHWSSDAFDGPTVRFDDVVQVLACRTLMGVSRSAFTA